MTDRVITAQCCIAGGGPAGMMLGFLLARAGVEVVVLEKHKDFLRDFRGDTIHPSTLELMHELGLLDVFLRLPHQAVTELGVQFGGATLPIADFTRLPTRCKFLAFMPQWDFLDFLAAQAQRFPSFRLLREAEVTGLIEAAGSVVGLSAVTPEGAVAVHSPLVVGCDGRHSTVRRLAGLTVKEIGAPMDVLWFRVTRNPADPGDLVGRFTNGRIFIMINRGDHWQCAFVIAKGTLAAVQARGLEAFRAEVVVLAPFLDGRMAEIAGWDDVKLLTVAVDRLLRWHRPGLLCIGDAAHAMSPVGGVGINLAIQDAVATANRLAAKLRAGTVEQADLAAVQQRRELPTQVTQWAQVQVQNRVIGRILAGEAALVPPLPLRLLARYPWLRQFPARLIGIGVRPEHVGTPG